VGRAVFQAVSRRPITTETQVGSQVSPCEICGGQSGGGTGFSPSTSGSPVTIHSSLVHTHLHVAFTRRTNGRSLGTYRNNALSEIWNFWRERYFHVVFERSLRGRLRSRKGLSPIMMMMMMMVMVEAVRRRRVGLINVSFSLHPLLLLFLCFSTRWS